MAKNILPVALLALDFLATSAVVAAAVASNESFDERVLERIVGTQPSAPPPPSILNASNATKAVFVDLTVVFDRSGSMSTMGGAPLESLNIFINEQQEAAIADDRLGTTTLRIVTFDDRVEVAYVGPLAAANINTEAVSPRGRTRLLDTAAEEIIAQRTRVEALRAHGASAIELFALITDGQDNASQEFCTESFHALVEDARDRGVLCLFLAANMDAITAGKSFGFAPSHSMTMDATPHGFATGSYSLSARSSYSMSKMWKYGRYDDWDSVKQTADDYTFSALERASAMPLTSRYDDSDDWYDDSDDWDL